MTEYKIHEIRRRVAQLVKRAQQNPDGSIGPVAPQPDYHYGDSVSGAANTLRQVGNWAGRTSAGVAGGWLLNELIHMPRPNPAFGISGSPDLHTALGNAQTILNSPTATAAQKRLARSVIASAQFNAQRSTITPSTGAWAYPGGLSRDAIQVARTLSRPDSTHGGVWVPSPIEAAMSGATTGGGLDFSTRAQEFLDEPIARSAPRGGRIRQWFRRRLHHGDARPRNGEGADELVSWARHQPIRVDTNGHAVPGRADESWIRRWAREAFSPHSVVRDSQGKILDLGFRGKVRKYTPWAALGGLATWGVTRAAGGRPQAGAVTGVDDYNPDFDAASQFTPTAPAPTPPSAAPAPAAATNTPANPVVRPVRGH